MLHDADADGYNIARTLAEETRRMPGYQVDVIDLGLRLADARALDLEFEQFTRKKALPRDLDLTPDELATFTGVRTAKDTWVAQRVELNAMAAPQLVAHIERGLARVGAIGKVVPPDDALGDEIESAQAEEVQDQVEAAVARLLHVPEIAAQVLAATRAHLPLADLRQQMTQGLAEDATQHWRAQGNRVPYALTIRVARGGYTLQVQDGPHLMANLSGEELDLMDAYLGLEGAEMTNDAKGETK